MTKLTLDDLQKAYEGRTAVVRAECTFSTECVGGQPADEEGVRQFVKYHLKIADEQEQEKAVHRILTEELQDVRPEEGEVDEHKMYGLRSLRRTKSGPYLGDWMVKACIKNAASRLEIFKTIRGSKGNFAEAGRVRAWKYSLQEPEHPNLIFVRNSTEQPCHSYHREFMGRVQTPAGQASIIHHSECIEAGSRFAFEFRFMPGKVTENDMRDVLAMCMVVGLGSARSLERGKFSIEYAEIDGLK
jgi:hypothetical protein